MNVSTGEPADCDAPGSVTEDVYNEHNDEPAETSTSTGGGQNESEIGPLEILAVAGLFTVCFLVVGAVVLLVRRRRGFRRTSGPAVNWTGTMVVGAVFVAAVIGAGVGSGLTLLVAERGPSGPPGEQGEIGPAGEKGPGFDPTDLQSRISGLETAVEELNGSPPISDDVLDDLEALNEAVADLQDSTIDLCTTLNQYCRFRRVSLESDGYGF